MTWLRAVWCRWRHTAFHRLTARGGELYLRCDLCGLRSPGIPVGERRYRSQLPGVDARHRVGPKLVQFSRGRAQ